MKADLNGVNPVIKRRKVLGRFLSFAYIIYLAAVFVPGCFWYGAKEFVPEVMQAAKKALGVTFLPWGDV